MTTAKHRRPGDAAQFYDDLAEYYDLIYEDWEASMARQGAALEQLMQAELGFTRPATVRVLDVACGIGTQALPLALRGFRVTGRDISAGAIARLGREAEIRQLAIDVGVADMRQVAESVQGPFDVVLAFDNSLPHLLTATDIVTALRECHKVLRRGGLLLCSVRDYDTVPRGEAAVHPYGERRRGADVYRLRQEWTWGRATHYQLKFVVERLDAAGPVTVLETVTRYFAVPIAQLLALMGEAGFTDCRRLDGIIYQPVLVGRRGPGAPNGAQPARV
jgi:SAM-dependent methyltransferase